MYKYIWTVLKVLPEPTIDVIKGSQWIQSPDSVDMIKETENGQKDKNLVKTIRSHNFYQLHLELTNET